MIMKSLKRFSQRFLQKTYQVHSTLKLSFVINAVLISMLLVDIAAQAPKMIQQSLRFDYIIIIILVISLTVIGIDTYVVQKNTKKMMQISIIALLSSSLASLLGLYYGIISLLMIHELSFLAFTATNLFGLFLIIININRIIYMLILCLKKGRDMLIKNNPYLTDQ